MKSRGEREREERTRETADERKRTGWVWGRKWEWETSHERFTSSGTDRGTPAALDTREREGGGGADNSKTSPYSCMSKSHTHAYMTTYNIWIGGACYSDHLSLLISESVIEQETIRRQEINRWTPVVSLFIFQCLFPFLPPLFAELRHNFMNI